MVPFAGWEMPVRYSSIIEEYEAVRKTAGVFDVSHMGELIVEGDAAKDFLEKITCNRVSDVEIGQVQYNAVLNERGGIVDDITIYKEKSNKYFIVVNASNVDKVLKYLQSNIEHNVVVRNDSDKWNQIAIQGPEAEEILNLYMRIDTSGIGYYKFKDFDFKNEIIRLSRTGYTGEDGFEIYSSPSLGIEIWDGLLDNGKPYGLLPCGLASRDILRLESLYALYGHELNDEWTPVESGIGWIVKEKEIKYPAYHNIINQKKNGPDKKVCAFILEENGIPRENYPVFSKDGIEIGKVLSGAYSPILKKGIGTAMLPSNYFNPGTDIHIEIRSKKIPAKIVKGAFVKGSARKKIKDIS
jgi:aminomethyltransferase